MQEEMFAEHEKVSQLAKTKNRLEETLDATEDALERERRARTDLDKQRRKTEGELKIAHENMEELGKQKSDVENAVRKWVFNLLCAWKYKNKKNQRIKL